MAQRNIQFVEGEFYHLYNRGNSKQEIFLDDHDRERFIKLLFLCNSNKNVNFRDDIVTKKIDAWDFDRGISIVSIGAWVLMPNHFHIFLTVPPTSDVGGEDGEDDVGGKRISLFIKKICISYSKYFNKKYNRSGGLFESNFKAKLTESDEQTKYNFSYIHLNPIKLINSQWKEKGVGDRKKALAFLDTYLWSSYHDYRNKKRPENKIISRKDFPDYFSNQKVFDEEIFEWLTFLPSPTSDVGEGN